MFEFADYIIFAVKFIWKICFKLLQKFNHAKGLGYNETLDFVLVDTCIYVLLFIDGHNETFDFAICIDVH